MKVQNVQNNNYNTNFGATLEIFDHNNKSINDSVIKYLKTKFSKRTENIGGKLELHLYYLNKNDKLII